MTSRALNLHPNALICSVILVWVIAVDSRAAESTETNPSAPPGAASSVSVLTNAEQVHWLTREEAAKGEPVLIRGVVTCALPEFPFNAAVVQDHTAGIYVDHWNPPLGVPPQVGELVEVEGITDPGDFAPRVHAVRITRLGTGELPPPIRPYWDQLINGSLDTEFVEMEGIVTTVRADGVTLLTHGGKIKVQILGTEGGTNNVAFKPYENALIRLRGCLFASWDATTHEVKVSEVRMFTPAVTVVEPAPVDAFAATKKRVMDLLQFDPQASALRLVKVSGQIVAGRGGEYYAMDGTNGFRFILKENASLGAGDLVEVVGFPSLTGPSPVLLEARARKIGVAPVPNARPLDADNLFRAENDAVRVRVEAVLLNVSDDQRTLELQTGLQRFVAQLDGNDRFAASARALSGARLDMPPGSRLELTGIYAGNGGNRTTGAKVANFELLLNTPADIRVLARPPFWTLPRLLVLVGALLGVLGLALIWIRLLHHRVQQRTAQLQKEMHEREQAENQRTLAQERARIARDLHDDLGSSLTEITMLATTGPGLNLPADEAAGRMETIAEKSRTLVNDLDEIVWAVDPERDTLASAARYLASYTEEYLAGLKIACRVHIPNSFPDQAVSGEVRHHLFLAVKEALNNAVRHGGASEIGFQIRVREGQLWISITDNGSGFESSGHSNGHGLLNLRNRLEQLHGRCELESSPGAGTTVSLQLPLAASNHLI
ncbi:MAG TPA: sensor histidine kinase [Candidatus Acidoferrales bacterium]|nr:sensor histidine kinase [Candidatus Acidoferrales bacterium]